jgi:hypothetical protein
MKLTARQQYFLRKLYELYSDFKQPIHYIALAKYLGVNKFSAYDMLKVLEKKGAVACHYVLGTQHSGPGRSMVTFYPTNLAISFLGRMRDEIPSRQEWNKLKTRILRRLVRASHANYTDYLRDCMSSITDNTPPLNFCVEAFSAILVYLAELTKPVAGKTLERQYILQTSIPIGAAELNTLAGMAIGSALALEIDDPSVLQEVLLYGTRLHHYLGDLSEDSVQYLASFVNEAIHILWRE